MNDGFTEQNFKGLFTFYREQGELERPSKRLFHPAQRNKKVNHSSLSHHQYRQQKERPLIAVNQPKLVIPQSERYTIVEEQGKIKTEPSCNPIVSLNFNLTSSRKNEFYFQLLGSQNRKRQLQIDTCFKKSPKLDYKKLITNLSVREIPAGEVKDLFKPRKDHCSNIHTVKKCPFKINSVIARQLQSDKLKGRQSSLLTEGNDEEKKFHMPVLRQSGAHARFNRMNNIFKDVLELRRHQLESPSFWQQLKEKKAKKVSSRQANTRMEVWTAAISNNSDVGSPSKG